MYRFHSLAETPLKSKGDWYTVMVGLNPGREGIDLYNPERNIFDLFVFNRKPKEGMYIEGASLEQALAFLSFANRNPSEVIKLHSEFAGSGITKVAVSLDEAIRGWGAVFQKPTRDFEIDPSFEPFIIPRYVDSETEFRNMQILERTQPYLGFCKAIGVKIMDDNGEYSRWIDRNASFARLAYIIRGGSHFKPLNYCREDNHYWDWFKAKNGQLFLRTVYISSEDLDTHILAKEKHPPEYGTIPEAVCPTHNAPLKLEDGFYIGEIPVSNEAGIHLRPIQSIAENAKRYNGKVFIGYNGRDVDAKKIMEVVQLGAVQGSRLKVWFEDVNNPKLMKLIHRFFYRAATTELR